MADAPGDRGRPESGGGHVGRVSQDGRRSKAALYSLMGDQGIRGLRRAGRLRPDRRVVRRPAQTRRQTQSVRVWWYHRSQVENASHVLTQSAPSAHSHTRRESTMAQRLTTIEFDIAVVLLHNGPPSICRPASFAYNEP